MRRTFKKFSSNNIRKFKSGWFEKTFPTWSPSYRQLGLLYQDIWVETPDVMEAVSRLPQEVHDARLRRQKLACNLDLQQYELPKEQWTTDETDVAYLDEYLDEVRRELEERRDFRNL